MKASSGTKVFMGTLKTESGHSSEWIKSWAYSHNVTIRREVVKKQPRIFFFKEDLEAAGWESSNAIENEHPLVKDKRFLNTAFFPSNEEITPVMFEDLENEN